RHAYGGERFGIRGSIGSWAFGLIPVERAGGEVLSAWCPTCFAYEPSLPCCVPFVCAGASGFTSGLPTLMLATLPPFRPAIPASRGGAGPRRSRRPTAAAP